jgi:hypothetical protein
MVCPKFNFHVYKLKKVRGNMGAHLFLFCYWELKEGACIGGVSTPKMFPQKNDDGTHELINMKHTTYKKRRRS